MRKFCDAVKAKSGATVRLPTEPEWEYACRAGTATQFNTGDGEKALDAAGWYPGNAEGHIHEVAGKAANAWGLYDMHGNVWQWCLGVDGDTPCLALRGGSWYGYRGKFDGIPFRDSLYLNDLSQVHDTEVTTVQGRQAERAGPTPTTAPAMPPMATDSSGGSLSIVNAVRPAPQFSPEQRDRLDVILCRSATSGRQSRDPSKGNDDIGFRLAVDVDQVGPTARR